MLKFPVVFSSYIHGISNLVPGCTSKRGKDFNITWGNFLFNFPEILFTNGPMPANFLSDSLTSIVSKFRVNQFIYLFKFTSQILISAFTDIMSAELFLNFFPVINVLSDFAVYQISASFWEALMQYRIECFHYL